MTKSDQKQAEPPKEPGRMMRFGIRHIMLAVFVSAIVIFLAVNFWQLMLLMLLTLVPAALVVGIVVAVFKRRATEQDALLRVMALATQHRLPLSHGIDAFADLCSFTMRRRNLALAYLLESGVPLPQALASVPGVLPSSAVVLACVGWNEGALSAALSEAVAASESGKVYRWNFASRLGYLAAVLFGMEVIVGFFLYFIAPKFEVIFYDFGVPLPAVTRFVIQSSHSVILLPAWMLLVLIQLGVAVYIVFLYFGWIHWELPLLDQLLLRRDTAAVVRSLSIGVEAGRPLPATIDLLSRFYPRNGIRNRLLQANRRIEQGMPWYEALRRHRLIGRGDAALLEAAQRAGNLAWALRVLADSNERRLGYRLQAISQALFPAIVIALGVIVGTICIAFFSPLVYLIESLA